MKSSMKIIFGIVAIFFVAVVSLGTIFAYRGNTSTKTPNYSDDVHLALSDAISKGDYNLWVKIREENNLSMIGRMFESLNEENFNKYSEMHNAMLSGDFERAEELKSELGINFAKKSCGCESKGSSCGSSGCGSCPYKN